MLSLASSLAPWDPSMCDGCSVPSWLRWLFPIENEAQRAVCCEHDRAYYYGGTEAQRLAADLALFNGLRRAGFEWFDATLYYYAVRFCGSPRWRWNEKRWSYGGGRYRYDRRMNQ